MSIQSDNPNESPSDPSSPAAIVSTNRSTSFHLLAALSLPLVLLPINQLHSFDVHGFPEFIVGGLISGLAFGYFRNVDKRPPLLLLFLCYFASSIASMLIWNAISLLWMIGGLGIVMSAFFAVQFIVGELIARGIQKLRRPS